MAHHLYMWSTTKTHFIEKHDFYVEQIKRRVLNNFSDDLIEADADRFGDEIYERYGQSFHPDRHDADFGVEAAYDANQNHFTQLYEMKKQMLLSALAGCFHQWEKELRNFLERELRHTVAPEDVIKYVWKQEISKIFDLLKDFGWGCEQLNFFRHLDASRLIVNVYKHGKGPSLSQLSNAYPQYLGKKKSLQKNEPKLFAYILRHEWLEISESDFDELTLALRQFWVEFPENLYYKAPPTP